MSKELDPTEKFKRALRVANMTAPQRKTLQKMIDFGCEQDEKIDNLVWFNGHSILVKPDGEVDEL